MTVYDYSKQEWVSGATAVAVRKDQIVRELSILRSDKAGDYVKCSSTTLEISHMIQTLETELASLNQ